MEDTVLSKLDFDPPSSARDLRPRDLITIATRPVGSDFAAPWQVAAMAKVAIDAMARPTGARRVALAEAAAVAVSAPAPLVARALLTLLSTLTTFRVCDLVAEVGRLISPDAAVSEAPIDAAVVAEDQ